MKNRFKIITLFGSLTLLSFLCVGCGNQTAVSDVSSTLGSVYESVPFESVVDVDIAATESIQEATQEVADSGLTIPDYNYDEYLTASPDDDTPVLGYNIPVGWTSENKGVWATLSKTQIVEQSFNVMFNGMSSIMLSQIENDGNGEFIPTEHPSVETPVGTFRVFTLDYIEDNHMDAQYAIMPVTEEKGVTVFFSYSDNWPHFYQGTIDLLLLELFGEKQPRIEIPDNYQYYLQSHTGEIILGANIPEGYKYSDYDYGTSEYETVLDFSSSDSHNISSISIMEYDTIAPIYSGTKDMLPFGWVPDTNEIANYEYYTEKGTYETPYGTAKLYDEKTEYNPALGLPYESSHCEIALLRLNGSYIVITYYADTRDVVTNDIEIILAQLF